jgi:iron(III) transport system substrate-binding protein
VNISGAGIARHSPNRAAAQRFLEYLVTPEAQKIYAEINYEYPVTAEATIHPLIKSLGPLKVDSLPLTKVAQLRSTASKLADKVGFDQ